MTDSGPPSHRGAKGRAARSLARLLPPRGSTARPARCRATWFRAACCGAELDACKKSSRWMSLKRKPRKQDAMDDVEMAKADKEDGGEEEKKPKPVDVSLPFAFP
eukprot:354214-Chlamydomonas_euryale.AAC.2